MEKQYQNLNGTSYNAHTSQDVINILEQIRNNGTRIVVEYGDTKTGKSWEETNNIVGYISRSTGAIKIPLLVYNTRSFGGSPLIDDCILKITTSKGKKVLYQHPNYQTKG